nr:uncharacterized protein LOC112039670 [Quercus suber]POE91020.1 hypothetical protein CFP56_05391 [Quercus suber]
MENGYGVSPCTWESPVILWLICGVLERHWFEHGPVVITEWLLNRDWEVRVEHIGREANSCADLSAKRGASQSEMEVLYDTCPTFLWQCLKWGSMGFVSSRSRCG